MPPTYAPSATPGLRWKSAGAMRIAMERKIAHPISTAILGPIAPTTARTKPIPARKTRTGMAKATRATIASSSPIRARKTWTGITLEMCATSTVTAMVAKTTWTSIRIRPWPGWAPTSACFVPRATASFTVPRPKTMITTAFPIARTSTMTTTAFQTIRTVVPSANSTGFLAAP